MHKVATPLLLKKERQDFIIKELNLHNKVLSSDLCSQLNVSEDTIRRDLNELAESGKLVKVHGGALSVSYSGNNSEDVIYAREQKLIIAKKAVSLIQDGMLILTSGGTTLREVIKLLPKDLNATFCTVSLMTAEELLKHPNIEVIFIGGKLSKDAKICVGGDSILKLGEMSFDLCLVGTNGIDAKFGVTDSDLEVVQVKKAMIKASKKLVVLSISEKLNTVCRGGICKPNEIDYLITELDAHAPELASYNQAGIKLL
jgi:DeoR/GlpR family transcriptional regulator of sugar metabolism